ncbi:class I SAM-dependent methyltransferase [Streptomyces fagopyri]
MPTGPRLHPTRPRTARLDAPGRHRAGAEVLGDVADRRVLNIGSRAAHHAVHLAQAFGARVTGIELSPTQYERAVLADADLNGVEFVQADVAEYLTAAEQFHAAYAIRTLGFIDPHRSLPALRDDLRPADPLAAAHRPARPRSVNRGGAARTDDPDARRPAPCRLRCGSWHRSRGRTCSPSTASVSRPSTCSRIPTRTPPLSSS